ncbi:MAG: thiamine pyrophosphate-binding protein, partial [Pseudomonadota bacterium]|nr:thiamine pyrophosphate-binding protein [Pseudomonadota bacterium]
MAKMTGAQALIAQLLSEGVDTLFALPGVQMMDAIDAIYEKRNELHMVQTRHEQATTYMADGYARVTGDVGVAMVVPGPGALNATAGLGTAYAASSPVLLISGQIPTTSLGKRIGELHEVEEQLDVFRPITKWVDRTTEVGGIPEMVHEAFHQLRTGRPRPVEIEVPPDTLAATDDVAIIDREHWAKAAPAEAGAIEQAARLLCDAEKPVIYAGGGVISSDASAELVTLAELLQAPVIMTQQGKGAVPDDHPLNIAVSYYMQSPIAELFAESDALLAVGTRLRIREDEAEVLPALVHMDIDPNEPGKILPTAVAIEADAKEGLTQLIEVVGAMGSARASRGDEIVGWRARFRDELRGLVPLQMDMLDTLRACLDDDAIVISGVTNVGYWGNICFPVKQPRTYITSSYFGTLGYAFPTALGAKIGNPDKQVVALSGDGGFMYCATELSTAVKFGINVVTVVFNNNAFGASRWDQTHRFGKRFIATDLHNPDLLMFAESFGAVGIRTDPAGLGAA